MNISPIILKSNGNSSFWILAPGMVATNPVKIRRGNLNGPIIYEGDVKRPHTNGQHVKVSVKPVRGDARLTQDDIIAVTITITNGGNASNSGVDVIIDDEPGLLETDLTY